MREVRAALAACWTLTALVGCNDGLGDCDAAIALCDVQEASCQEHIFRATACQKRQKAGGMPPIRSITSEQFADELSTDFTPGQPDAWDVGLGLLGLIDTESSTGSGAIDALVEGVLGFYDPRTREVTLLSDTSGLTREVENLVLSHEFVHVLQDRDVGLLEFDRAATSDGSVANDALTEGEAVLHSNVAVSLGDGLSGDRLDWMDYYQGIRENVFGAIDDSRSPLIQAFLNLPYPIGGEFVTDAWLDGGQKQIHRLYGGQRVLSLADWQQGYPAGVDSPRPQLSCDAPEAPAEFELFGEDVLGPAGIAALWAAQEAGAAFGWKQAHAWRGGRTWVYARGGSDDTSPDATLLLWHTRWNDADAAQAVRDVVGQERTFMRERSVLIVVSDSSDAAAWAADRADTWLACGGAQKALRKGRAQSETRGRRWWPGTTRKWFTRTMLPKAQ